MINQPTNQDHQFQSTSKLNPQPINLCSFGPRLGFAYFKNPIPDHSLLNNTQSDSYWFTIDSLLIYLSFFQDTGPLNCACLYRFCLHLHGLLEDERLSEQKIVMYSSEDPDKKANSALLMCLYCMIVLRWSPADALHPISHLEFQPFRDAGYARADFNLSIQNVLFGIKKAIDLRLLRLDEFDLREYETFEKVENGDYNWLSPHFIAFASPVEHVGHGNRINKNFRMILDQFEKVGVKLVIRLNKKLYDENRFLERGIAHREMYFDDGTNPTMDMVKEFIRVSERIIDEGGVVAVHCKAGLGRTGTLIGAYLIYKYNFTAEEVIGFMRIMRPGTCVGPQQHFLYENQMTWARWAARNELLAEQESNISPSKTERPITPPPESNPVQIPSAITTPPPNPNHVSQSGIGRSASRPTGGKSLIEQEEEQQRMRDTGLVELNNKKPNSVCSRATTNMSRGVVGLSNSPIKSAIQPGASARPRPRPASALSDHRPAAAGLVRRSGKAVKEMGTLFEGLNSSESIKDQNHKIGGNRYNLRGGGIRVVSSTNGGTAAERNDTNPNCNNNNNNSPSRLPQRVINRRRGAGGSSSNLNAQQDHNKLNKKEWINRNNNLNHRNQQQLRSKNSNSNGNCDNLMIRKGLGVEERSVRRRRSSLSHADVLM
ncbi:protein-tyrosine phosphatase-like protein [Phakopsora pachyrhizi]|uniref:protein-tyrosine-phosphatase n=1 Tax=Phakopsora pachyrhizi TaxID=170000 RepID=A0AAV0AFD0_PHAPC|nr:protein-tyrosine phosphatase-like protein [Phakopsora pachyrhizi]CAH7666813.1 protein-tyrosine phosphatase-like protein [Phakopsora pachyrhizi]